MPKKTLISLMATILGCSTPQADADLLLVNARVYTLTWGQPAPDGTNAPDAPRDASGWHPDAEAIAIKNDEIVFVGSNENASAYAGTSTRTIDLAGATVLPGFVDSHTHVRELGENLGRVNLLNVATEAEAIARIVERKRDAPPGEWIIGYGWDEGAWANRYPTWDRLSEQFPVNPVVLRSLHGFAIWANRLAFELAGISPSTDAPIGGEIVRDSDGELTGILLNRAGTLMDSAIPADSPRQTMTNYHAGLSAMAEAGYVAVHEAGAMSRDMNALEALEQDESLPIRVYAMLSARDEGLMRRWIDQGPRTGHERMMQVRSVKAYYDGALGSRGARLIEDYHDTPGHRGVSGDGYGFDEALVAEAMRAGFQVGIHAIGDAGNRETLDFLERVIDGTPEVRNNRSRVEHAQVVHPDDFARFGVLDVIASMEPPHAAEDKAWAEERLGPERILGAYAWREMRMHNARLIFNSDLPGSDHSIFYGLHAAITRRDKDLEPPSGWYPEQSVTVEEAVRAYTSWTAYAAFLEDVTGVIEVGRWADLTILDIDPFVLAETDPAAILDGKVLMTIVAGKVAADQP